MNLAYFSRPYRRQLTSGGNAHVGQFLNHVIAAGHTVWTSMPDDRADTHPLPPNRLRRLLQLRRMDALYFRLEWQPRSQCRLARPPYPALLGHPLVAWELNTVPEYGRLLGATDADVAAAVKQLQRLGRGCDVAFAVSPAIAAYARDVLGLRHVVTVCNGSDPDRFHPTVPPALPRGPGAQSLRVVWLGSAALAWHDLDAIMAAAAALDRDGWGARIAFHLIGEGTRELGGLTANVTVHGGIPYGELPAWLASMDVGLSLYKPGPAAYSPGLKTFDYMAAGLTVVAYDQPVYRDLFAEMHAPQPLIPEGNADALAKMLKTLWGDPARRAACGAAGRHLIQTRYNWKQIVRATLAAMEAIRGRA